MWRLALTVLLLAAGRGCSSKSVDACDFQGGLYPVDQPFEFNCLTCVCHGNGTVVCARGACFQDDLCHLGMTVVLAVGETLEYTNALFTAPESCSTCTCEPDLTLTCRESDCSTIPMKCSVDGGTVAVGELGPPRGCNTCRCAVGGTFGCTLQYCDAGAAVDAATD
jgi:hypothetical protein